MKFIFCYLVLLFLGIYVNGQEIAKVENKIIFSKALNQQRELLIYTPKAYNENTLAAYDVIYVFDAQNRELFDFTHSVISFLSNGNKEFIVVGVTSPYNKVTDYARNNDFLPVLEMENDKKRYGNYSGNAENFLRYIKTEVAPFIDSSYRTRARRIAVGHSLSASFIIYSLIKEPGLFNDYLALSPNFGYDGERLAREFTAIDLNKKKEDAFLYLSNANEGIGYWEDWEPARNKVYSFLKGLKTSGGWHFLFQKFPDESHWSSIAPALMSGLKEYFQFLKTKRTAFTEEVYEIRITVVVPNKGDEVFITGNQASLGDWNPALIQLCRTTDTTREIKIKVRTPIEFKLTRGSWETEGEIEGNGGMNNLYIDPKRRNSFQLRVLHWADSNE